MVKFTSIWGRRLFFLAAACLGLITMLAVVLAVYVTLIDSEIQQRFEQLRSQRSSTFYAVNPAFYLGQTFPEGSLDNYMVSLGYNKAEDEALLAGSYRWDKMGADYLRSMSLFRPAFTGAGHKVEELRLSLLFERTEQGKLKLTEIQRIEDGQTLLKVKTPPRRLGFFFAGRVRTQHSVSLSEIPVALRLAVMAIEDSDFLEHHGMSFRGTLRAVYKDIIALKFVQGGSTITQQCMKILFFSHEKVLVRKLVEALYAFVAEARHSKDEILEAYLNEVYLGQWNTHEIHGVSEAARYYFGKSVRDLDLAESATLAGIIQRPNYFNPKKRPEETSERRNRVLNRMLEEEFILDSEYQAAKATPIYAANVMKNLDDTAYFMDLVMSQLPASITEKLDDGALTIYLSLNPYLQASAKKVLSGQIAKMESWYKTLKEKKEAGFDLQGALISIDPRTCGVLALQGGTSFKQTQFNRVLLGKRQPGSLFKPFVYLAAFENLRKDRPPFTPMTDIEDTPFEWKYEGQSWSPKNYDEENRESVTVRQALERSINIPTARIAERVGIAKVRSTLIQSGIRSPLPKVPSISLGSAEVTPFELAESYTALANLGDGCELRAFYQVYDDDGALILDNPKKSEQRLDRAATFQAVQLMKGVFREGTATLANGKGIPTENFAGKTGTTNDYKDAWFVGFSPEIVTLIWVGYDEEQTVGLSGSAASLPIWIDYMKQAQPVYTDVDFDLPEEIEYVQVDIDRKCLAKPGSANARWEYFYKGTAPENTCP